MLDGPIRQQAGNSTGIERRIEQARGQQSPNLTGEDESAGNFRDIERLDSDGVARQHEALAGHFVISEREHSLEAGNGCLGTPEGQRVQKRLRVAMALKTDALRF